MTGESQDEIQQDIEATRERLGETIDQLGEKFDVKKQARAHQQQLGITAGAVVLLAVALVVWRRTR
ncbi:DUF3618 domain-containing protein [Nocardioides alcanivorans]|uniref:DUF3618 domain-containing protein n=1 Tax=Nocardioides alcanivorans TaxID=2897352 RepID=UPI001F35B16F|nr:DUF3618 domain-containing protein [Nocardioides alcanivorans]